MDTEQDYSTLYRLIVQPLRSVRGDVFATCAREFKALEGFSLNAIDRDHDSIEYRVIEKGQRRCTLQITPDGISLETSRDGVNVEDWHRWRDAILKIVSNPRGIDWTPNDLSVLAIVHQYRIPIRGKNIYEVLRDKLVTSLYREFLGDCVLLDLDLQFKAILDKDLDLIIKLNSNQTPDEIRCSMLDDEKNRATFDFHVIRRSQEANESLIELADFQEKKLIEFLEKSNVQEIITELMKP